MFDLIAIASSRSWAGGFSAPYPSDQLTLNRRADEARVVPTNAIPPPPICGIALPVSRPCANDRPRSTHGSRRS